jgi:uncharacterized protein YbaP (TraB family)
MLKLLFRRLAAALGLTVLLLGAPASAEAPTAHPALWQVSDADTTIYLFGTIHLLPENYHWRTSRFDEAVEGSQQLVVETIVDLKHPEAFAAAFARMSLSPTPLPPVLERVPPAKRAALAASLAKLGLKPSQLDPLKTWVVAFQLMSLQFADFGLHGQEAPEAVLRQAFTAEHKPVGQLETIEQQLGFFDSMSEDAQRSFLAGFLDNPEAAKQDLFATLGAWGRGDVRALAKEFRHEMTGSPELKQALFDRRNANWAKWIEHRLDQPGTIMVAVGADHLAARDSVIDLLRQDGFRVRRLQ